MRVKEDRQILTGKLFFCRHRGNLTFSDSRYQKSILAVANWFELQTKKKNKPVHRLYECFVCVLLDWIRLIPQQHTSPLPPTEQSLLQPFIYPTGWQTTAAQPHSANPRLPQAFRGWGPASPLQSLWSQSNNIEYSYLPCLPPYL